MTSSDASIIGPDDPAPYSIINERGKASVLLAGDHVSNVIPKSLDNLGLDEATLQQHIAYDIGTRKLIYHLVEHLDAPAVLAGYSRLVVDLNRSLEDPSVMPEVSDDVVIPGNQNMSREHRNERIHCCYTPYRKAIDTMLHRCRENGVVPAFISIHSFTPQMAGFVRPWHAGILWDKDPRIPLPLMANLCAHPDGFNIDGGRRRTLGDYSARRPARDSAGPGTVSSLAIGLDLLRQQAADGLQPVERNFGRFERTFDEPPELGCGLGRCEHQTLVRQWQQRLRQAIASGSNACGRPYCG
jgi:predicted N-formylglutamate amidohydrolase